jgi:hypothetical protein
LSQEIPAWSAVEFLRIECVEEALQLNSYSPLPRVVLDYSNRAGEVQVGFEVSEVSLRKRRPGDFNTLRVVGGRAQGACSKDLRGIRVYKLRKDSSFRA